MTVPIAVVSASGGREARKSSYVRLGVHAVRGDDLGVLRVDDEQPVERGDLGHRGPQLRGRQRRELRHPGVEQEALEAEHPRLPQLGEVTEALRHGPAPEADVDAALPGGGGALGLEGGDAGRRRHRVQRHVEDRRHATGRGGAGRGGEALPLRPAGLVHVHVGVDEARAAAPRRPRARPRRRAPRRPAVSDQSETDSTVTTRPPLTTTRRSTTPSSVSTRPRRTRSTSGAAAGPVGGLGSVTPTS